MARIWQNHEVLHVMNNAGFHSVESMARFLCRTTDDIEQLLSALGIDGVLLCPEIKQCVVCHSWRTELNHSEICRICSLKKSIAKSEAACSEVFSLLPPELKEIYNDEETKRGSRVFDPKPKPPLQTAEQDPIKTRLNNVAYTVAMEQWEIRAYQRKYDAVKQRLHRMRENAGLELPRAKKQ